MIQRVIGVQQYLVASIVLEKHSICIAWRLILLVEISRLEFVTLVCRLEVDIILMIVWVLVQLGHGEVQLIQLFADLNKFVDLRD